VVTASPPLRSLPRKVQRSVHREVGELLLWALREPEMCGEMPPLRPDVDTALVNAAAEHGVVGLLDARLRQCGALDALGAPARDFLQRWRVDITAQHLRAHRELQALAAALAASGIRWVVIKGPAVAALGYDDPALRLFVDVDVLVNSEDFVKVIDLLCENGAVLLDVNWEAQLKLDRAEAELLLPFQTPLDLHWHPVNNGRARGTTDFDVGAILSRKRSLSVGSAGAELPVPDATDNIILVALHGSLSGGHKLTWLKDLERLSFSDPPDWALLVGQAGAAGVGPPVGLMLQRSVRLLGAAVPAVTIKGLLGRRPWADALTAAERLATPTSLGRFAHTGMTIMSSVRGSPKATVASFLGVVLRHARARVQEVTGSAFSRNPAPTTEPGGNPLRLASSDPAARSAYLDAITTGSGKTDRMK
jgi:putative nucleotidyltransferase-like protein